MSLTRVVPAAVPSLRHCSAPAVPSFHDKNSFPLKSLRHEAFDPPLPGRMSLTRVVPAAVPSLFHSSHPCAPSSAVKNRVPLTFVSPPGDELFGTYHQFP